MRRSKIRHAFARFSAIICIVVAFGTGSVTAFRWMYRHGLIGSPYLHDSVPVDDEAWRAERDVLQIAADKLDDDIRRNDYPAQIEDDVLKHWLEKQGMCIVGWNDVGPIDETMSEAERQIIEFYEDNYAWKNKHPQAFEHPTKAWYEQDKPDWMRLWVQAEALRLRIIADDMTREMQHCGIPEAVTRPSAD